MLPPIFILKVGIFRKLETDHFKKNAPNGCGGIFNKTKNEGNVLFYGNIKSCLNVRFATGIAQTAVRLCWFVAKGYR